MVNLVLGLTLFLLLGMGSAPEIPSGELSLLMLRNEDLPLRVVKPHNRSKDLWRWRLYFGCNF